MFICFYFALILTHSLSAYTQYMVFISSFLFSFFLLFFFIAVYKNWQAYSKHWRWWHQNSIPYHCIAKAFSFRPGFRLFGVVATLGKHKIVKRVIRIYLWWCEMRVCHWWLLCMGKLSERKRRARYTPVCCWKLFYLLRVCMRHMSSRIFNAIIVYFRFFFLSLSLQNTNDSIRPSAQCK